MLALALGGRSILEWQKVMTRAEFESWRVFHQLYPFDDLHRFHRPAALVASCAGFGAKDGDSFRENAIEWLQPPPVATDDNNVLTDVDREVFRAFGLKPPR